MFNHGEYYVTLICSYRAQTFLQNAGSFGPMPARTDSPPSLKTIIDINAIQPGRAA